MASNRIVLSTLCFFTGCGVSAVKPDPPMDQSQQFAQAAMHLNSVDAVQRKLAIGTLGMGGPAAKTHLDELKKHENDSDPDVRNLVKFAILKIEKGE